MSDRLDWSLQSCIVFAARYAHSRNTGAALSVINAIKANWDKLDEGTKEDLRRESHEATENLHDWSELRYWIEKESPTPF